MRRRLCVVCGVKLPLPLAVAGVVFGCAVCVYSARMLTACPLPLPAPEPRVRPPPGAEVESHFQAHLMQKLKEENAKLRRELVDGGAAGATPFQQSLVAALTEENEDLKQRLMKIGQDPYVAIEGEAAKSGAGYPAQSAPEPATPPPTPKAAPARSEEVPSGQNFATEQLRSRVTKETIGVLVIACKRPKYLERALMSFKNDAFPTRDAARFPIVVSQDGDDHAMAAFLKGPAARDVYTIQHPQPPELRKQDGYHKLAVHFGFALGRMFDDFGFSQVIVLEEDMLIAADFYEYFGALLPILRGDKTLYCVSAWNDNGVKELVHDAQAIFRTDVFPGLGWMLTKELWDEFKRENGGWPTGWWDEWMRRPDVRKGRQCLRPEVNRAYTFGEEGESSGQYFKSHLSKMSLNDKPVRFEEMDLSYLTKDTYDKMMTAQIDAADEMTLDQLRAHSSGAAAVRIRYSQAGFGPLANFFGLMPDEKEGMRRSSYRQVLAFSWKEHRVFLYEGWPFI